MVCFYELTTALAVIVLPFQPYSSYQKQVSANLLPNESPAICRACCLYFPVCFAGSVICHLYCDYSTILLTVWIGPQFFALVTQIPFLELDA